MISSNNSSTINYIKEVYKNFPCKICTKNAFTGDLSISNCPFCWFYYYENHYINMPCEVCKKYIYPENREYISCESCIGLLDKKEYVYPCKDCYDFMQEIYTEEKMCIFCKKLDSEIQGNIPLSNYNDINNIIHAKCFINESKRIFINYKESDNKLYMLSNEFKRINSYETFKSYNDFILRYEEELFEKNDFRMFYYENSISKIIKCMDKNISTLNCLDFDSYTYKKLTSDVIFSNIQSLNCYLTYNYMKEYIIEGQITLKDSEDKNLLLIDLYNLLNANVIYIKEIKEEYIPIINKLICCIELEHVILDKQCYLDYKNLAYIQFPKNLTSCSISLDSRYLGLTCKLLESLNAEAEILYIFTHKYKTMGMFKNRSEFSIISKKFRFFFHRYI